MGLSRRMLILLDVIWGVVTLLSLVGALLPGSPFGMGVVVTSVIGCVAMGAGWILHRRTADRRWMILTYAGVLGATLNSSGGLGLLVVILVLALVVAAWGLWWGVARARRDRRPGGDHDAGAVQAARGHPRRDHQPGRARRPRPAAGPDPA
ncbi:hypothetical protein GCM10027418_32150 [Mariniluteicoccus endophyticus]